MKKWIELDFEIGDMVYLKTDEDQRPRVVFGVLLRPAGIMYDLACGTCVSTHYNFEINVEVDIKLKTSDSSK